MPAVAARWRWFGLIGAIGLFTRFTFVVFGAVLSLCMIIDGLRVCLATQRDSTHQRGATAADKHGEKALALWWSPLLWNMCGGAAVFLASRSVDKLACPFASSAPVIPHVHLLKCVRLLAWRHMVATTEQLWHRDPRFSVLWHPCCDA